MPLYDYVCDACGHRFEIIQRFSDTAPDACPSCGKGPLVRQFSSPAIQFKGSGFYITDYGKDAHKKKAPTDSKGDGSKGESASGGGDGAAPTSEKSSGDSAKSDAKPAESKPAPKPSGDE